MSTFETLKQLVIKKYSLSPDVVTPEATLESLALDSLDVIELLFDVEETFNIRIPQDAGPALRAATLQDMVDSVDKILAEKAAAPPVAQAVQK